MRAPKKFSSPVTQTLYSTDPRIRNLQQPPFGRIAKLSRLDIFSNGGGQQQTICAACHCHGSSLFVCLPSIYCMDVWCASLPCPELLRVSLLANIRMCKEEANKAKAKFGTSLVARFTHEK